MDIHPASAEAFRTGRPTIYNGIPMRSRLEANWAQSLDASGVGWKYEGAAYADINGQYLPDFIIYDPTYGNLWIADVKARLPADGGESLRRRMEIVWSSEPEVRLMILIGFDEDGMTDRVDRYRRTYPSVLKDLGYFWLSAVQIQHGIHYQLGGDSTWKSEWELHTPDGTIDYELLDREPA